MKKYRLTEMGKGLFVNIPTECAKPIKYWRNELNMSHIMCVRMGILEEVPDKPERIFVQLDTACFPIYGEIIEKDKL